MTANELKQWNDSRLSIFTAAEKLPCSSSGLHGVGDGHVLGPDVELPLPEADDPFGKSLASIIMWLIKVEPLSVAYLTGVLMLAWQFLCNRYKLILLKVINKVETHFFDFPLSLISTKLVRFHFLNWTPVRHLLLPYKCTSLVESRLGKVEEVGSFDK